MRLVGVRELREQRYLTLAELAERAGLSEAHLSRLERGQHRARISTVRRLAQALGVEPSAIAPVATPLPPAASDR